MWKFFLLAKTLLALCFTGAKTISVTHNGVTCPCMSYYSFPDYQCLLNQLKSNKTIPPVCIELLQGLDPAQAFTISESFNFQCAENDTVYMFKPGAKPELIPPAVCQSVFGGLVSFHIASQRKLFYEVVSRNLEILGLGTISCQLSSIPKWFDQQLCYRWLSGIVEEWTDGTIYLSFDYTYGNESLELTNFTIYDNNFVVGFSRSNWNSKKALSLGKMIINNTQMSTEYYKLGHMLTLNCSWGAKSPYYGNASTCLETNWERIHKLNLYLNHQRTFENSCIVLGFYWDQPKIPVQWAKDWNVVCKFFDTSDLLDQPESCVLCFETRNPTDCSKCWDSASMNGSISPYLNYTEPSSISDNLYHQTEFQLLTNFRFVTSGHGSFLQEFGPDMNHTHSNDTFDIFQYDYFFGNYSRYWKSKAAKNKYMSWLSKSVVLPGHQKKPTALTNKQINSLGAMCKLRVMYSDNTFSQWSNTVTTIFNNIQIFSTSAAVVFESDGKDFYDFIGAKAWSQRITTYWNRIFKTPDSQGYFNGCYRHKVFTTTLLFTKNQYILIHTSTYDHMKFPINFTISDIHASSKPLVLKCAALHPFILWTEQVEQSDKFKVFRANLSSLTGKPLSNSMSELSQMKLCSCSTKKSITSPSIQITYRNLNDQEMVEIAVACGKLICLTDLKMGKSARIEVPWKPTYGNIISFAIDQNFTYFVTSDDLSHVKVLTAPNTVLVHSTRGPKIKQIIPRSEKSPQYLPIPLKQCIDPYVNTERTRVSMTWNASSIKITVAITWNSSDQCAQFSKTPVILLIKYAILSKGLNVSEGELKATHPEISCTSQRRLKCTHLSRTILYGRNMFTTTISQIVHDRHYLIQVRLKAGTYHILWYHGQTVDKRQTYREIIFTKFRQQSALVWALPLAVGSLLVIIIVSGTFYWLYTRKMYLYKHLQRLSAKDVQKIEKLGEGNFGEVWKAKIAKDTVVIKMLKESATDREEKEFREEALLLSKFKSDYIVHAIGICLQTRPIMLGLEYINGGSLNSYLRRNEVRSALDSGDLLRIAGDALNGCIYLEQEGYIHRDIASRNCLVELMSDTNVKPKYVKLSDFGLAKDIGAESIYGSRDPDSDTLPIAWTAPEAFSGKFSPKSDIWAFGVLIWEIFTWAATPYRECSSAFEWHICPMHSLGHDEIEFRVCAERKNLLDFPDPCTAVFCDALKSVLAVCWKFEVDDRPSFKQLQKYLNGAKADIYKIDVQMQKGYEHEMGSTSSSSAVTRGDVRGGQRRNLMTSAYDTGTVKSDDVENPFDVELFTEGNRKETVCET